MPNDPPDNSDLLEKPVYVGESYKPFGDLTGDDARTMAEHFRGLSGGGLELKIAPVAMAWAALAKKLDEAGGAVSALEPAEIERFGRNTRVVPPGGTLLA